jgi:hypothetical protein
MFAGKLGKPFAQICRLMLPVNRENSGFWCKSEVYGIKNEDTGEILLPARYRRILPASDIREEVYDGFTAHKNGRWYFAELICGYVPHDRK